MQNTYFNSHLMDDFNLTYEDKVFERTNRTTH